MLAALRTKIFYQVWVERLLVYSSPEIFDGLARPVSWQLKHCRSAGELLFPVGELFVEDFAGEELALPDRVVGILNGQFWQAVRAGSLGRLRTTRPVPATAPPATSGR